LVGEGLVMGARLLGIGEEGWSVGVHCIMMSRRRRLV